MKKIRNSNIELLRIIAMLTIVTGHLISQGGAIENYSSKIFSIYAGSAARISVNIFLFIGVYFMVDSNFNAERILDLWGELFLYTLCFTGVSLLFDHDIPVKNLIKAILPFSTRALWFASAYLILICLHPFLKYVFLLAKNQFIFLICTLTYVMCIMPTFAEKQSDFIVNVAWFIYVYILVGGLKKYTKFFEERRYLLQKYGTAIAILIYFVLASCKIVPLLYDTRYSVILCNLGEQYLSDIKSIPNVLCALSVFVDVVTKKPSESQIINKVARSTFAVYIIHQTPAFFPVLWSRIIHTEFWFSFDAPKFILFLTISVLFIFVFGSLIENFREKRIEPIYKKSMIYFFLTKRVNEILKIVQ